MTWSTQQKEPKADITLLNYQQNYRLTVFIFSYRSVRYCIYGFFCGVLSYVKFCGKVSTTKKSIAENKLNIALKMSTCRAALLGTCTI